MKESQVKLQKAEKKKNKNEGVVTDLKDLKETICRRGKHDLDISSIGIYLDDSENNTISTCKIYDTTYKGIYISGAKRNKIEHCKIINNPRGIDFTGSGSTENLIVQNNISDNSFYGIYIPSECKSNSISQLNFRQARNHARQEYGAFHSTGCSIPP